MNRKRPSQRQRQLRASLRDTQLLLREFAGPLAAFALAMIGGGLLYYWLSLWAREPIDSVPESIYQVLSLTFLQPFGDFPQAWYLQIFFFAMPLIGIGILAQGLADFGVLFFNRRARGKEWEMAVASTFNNHIVLVGMGHLGFRVMRALHDLGEEVVVVELKPNPEMLSVTRRYGIPVIEADGSHSSVLTGAGVERARVIMMCTQNDSLNLQIAFRARTLNPAIGVVIRIFDDGFAQAVESQFGFRALSATGMSAPAFAAAAANVDITRPLTIEGESLSLARLDVLSSSSLPGTAVSEIEQAYNLSVVMLRRDGQSDFHPRGDRLLAARDVLVVLGGVQQISRLADDTR